MVNLPIDNSYIWPQVLPLLLQFRRSHWRSTTRRSQCAGCIRKFIPRIPKRESPLWGPGETNSPRAFLVGSTSVAGPSGDGTNGLLSAITDRLGPRKVNRRSDEPNLLGGRLPYARPCLRGS
jgi:hypothetical protein